MEALCPTSGMTPTGGNGTTGRTGRFEDLIRQDRPQDPKRWALIRGTQTVMGGFTVLCLAAAKQVLLGKGDIQQSRISDLGAEMRNTTKRYADIIAERSGLDPRKVRSWCRGDRFFGAQEALDLGLADGISTPRQRSSK